MDFILSYFADSDPKIPTTASAPPNYYGRAAEAESRGNLESSSYFYAGKAWPEFGLIAMAFSPAIETQQKGEANPFDTGGVLLGFIRARKLAHDSDRVKLVRKTRRPLSRWRKAFAKFLAAYFKHPRDYFVGRPSRLDAQGLFGQDNRGQWLNDFRCFTWECRFFGLTSMSTTLTWSADPEVFSIIESNLEKVTLARGTDSLYHKIIERRLSTNWTQNSMTGATRPGSPEFAEQINEWIRGQLF